MRILIVSENFERKKVDLRECPPDELVMMIDMDRCISCGACELACQIEHGEEIGAPGPFRPITISSEDEQGLRRTLYLPLACRHCEEPCDYYSLYNFWTTCPKAKEGDKIIPCDCCRDRTEKGLWPACATRCSMKTIYFGYAKDIAFTLGEKRLREMGDVELPEQ
jgi:Fe-S-cluster-containing dehydrogenase component